MGMSAITPKGKPERHRWPLVESRPKCKPMYQATVIKVENLSKSDTISHQNGERYTALRDMLVDEDKKCGE